MELAEGSAVLFGRVIGLRDVITFQGKSVDEVTQAFQDSVDDYLAICDERRESPAKPDAVKPQSADRRTDFGDRPPR